MKRAFTLLVVLLFYQAQAGDTLTRAQVYNFNVGDTFDYQYASSTTVTFTNSNTASVTYARYVVTNIYYSPDSSLKFIDELQVFPQPAQPATTVINNLNQQQVIFDITTTCFGTAPQDSPVITIDSVSKYDKRAINTVVMFTCGLTWQTSVYAAGLGRVLCQQYYGGGGFDESVNNSTELIYFASDTESWGTPYYNCPTEIEANSTNTIVTLYPTIGNVAFIVSVPRDNFTPLTFIIYDLTGREIYRSTLNCLTNTLNITPPSMGVYIWKALSQDKLVQTGKIVLHE